MTVRIPLDKGLTSKRIVVCKTCQGTGVRECSELENYHRGEYDYWKELCKTCGGEGRMVEGVHRSRVELEMPDGSVTSHHVESLYQDPLSGRKTQDIYKIGRDA
jgi:hypothetical protein